MTNIATFLWDEDFFSRHTWLVHLAILLPSILILYYLLENYYLLDVENARYLLSALAQAQAAIIAIIVSLTLIAMQISAQTYSPRVIDVFKEYLGFWVLIAVYGISIFFDVFAIYSIPSNPFNQYFDYSNILNLAILTAFTAFIALFLFISNTIDLLKPKVIIDKLGNKINVEIFLETINNKYSINKYKYSIMLLADSEDQIVPLIDIIKKAIRSDDATTARDGINKLESILLELLNCEGNKEGVIKHFCEHLRRVSSVCFTENNEDIIIELSKSLERIADEALTINGITSDAISFIVSLLTELGEESSSRGWKEAVTSILNSIGMIFISAEKSGFLITHNVGILVNSSLEKIISRATENDLSLLRFYILQSLKEICIKAIYEIPEDSKYTSIILQKIVSNIVEVIVDIKTKLLKHEEQSLVHYFILYDIICILTEIGASIADIEKKSKINESMSSIVKKKIIDFCSPFTEENDWFIYSIGNLGFNYSNSLSEKVEKWEDEIEYIGRYGENNEIKCEFVLYLLKDIGVLCKDKSFDKLLMKVGGFIISIGNNGIISKSQKIAEFASKTLKELDIDDLIENELKGNLEFKKMYSKET